MSKRDNELISKCKNNIHIWLNDNEKSVLLPPNLKTQFLFKNQLKNYG